MSGAQQHIAKCDKCGQFVGENGHECRKVAIGELGTTQKALLEFLEEHGESRRKDLAESLDMPIDSVGSALRRLHKRNLVVSRPDPNPRRVNGSLYRLASQKNPDRLGVF